MPDFRLPDLGEGLESAEIVAWRVEPGDRVQVDQIVVEVETAKAAVEVPVPFAGVVSALHARAGETVRVGAPLITVEPVAATGGTGRGEGFREPGVAVAAEESGGSGNVLIGYGTNESPRRRRRAAGARAAVGDRPAEIPARGQPAEPPAGPVPVISPLVRKLARDAGIDLTAVAGTGPSGLVRRCDVEAVMHTTGRGGVGETRIPLTGVRKQIADKLSRSRREIPEATVWVDVDATELLAARAAITSEHQPVSLLALLSRFAVLALRRYPELNARIERDEIVIGERVHLGFAAQTERGLLVPVVRGADQLSTRELSAALAERTAAARAGRLAPADLTGGTFTVNNYGVFGVDGSAAIINYPEVAILGMGRIIDRPWVVDGQLSVRRVGQLTLAFDHRVCDGGTAGGFLRYVADCVERPISALADL